jgi:ketosteroid isomerase-like protein
VKSVTATTTMRSDFIRSVKNVFAVWFSGNDHADDLPADANEDISSFLQFKTILQDKAKAEEKHTIMFGKSFEAWHVLTTAFERELAAWADRSARALVGGKASAWATSATKALKNVNFESAVLTVAEGSLISSETYVAFDALAERLRNLSYTPSLFFGKVDPDHLFIAPRVCRAALDLHRAQRAVKDLSKVSCADAASVVDAAENSVVGLQKFGASTWRCEHTREDFQLFMNSCTESVSRASSLLAAAVLKPLEEAGEIVKGAVTAFSFSDRVKKERCVRTTARMTRRSKSRMRC